MVQLTFQGQHYQLQPDETVLDCLLRYQLEVPYGCRSGICQSCMMQLVSGSVPEMAQQGLKPSLQDQQCFLPCRCHPTNDIEFSWPDQATTHAVTVTVQDKQWLNHDIVQLKLQCQSAFDYRAGQFIHLHHPQKAELIRSYSLASVPTIDAGLELHVRHIPHGRMSGWVSEQLAIGQQCQISGPLGDCYYTPGQPQQGLLLMATGSGLAPLWGVLRDALYHQHAGPILLYHGAHSVDDLYLVEALRQLEQQATQFRYFPCLDPATVAENKSATQHIEESGLLSGYVQELALQRQADLKGWKVYLCGNPAMVAAAKRQVYLAGASLNDIHSDPFILATS